MATQSPSPGNSVPSSPPISSSPPPQASSSPPFTQPSAVPPTTPANSSPPTTPANPSPPPTTTPVNSPPPPSSTPATPPPISSPPPSDPAAPPPADSPPPVQSPPPPTPTSGPPPASSSPPTPPTTSPPPSTNSPPSIPPPSLAPPPASTPPPPVSSTPPPSPPDTSAPPAESPPSTRPPNAPSDSPPPPLSTPPKNSPPPAATPPKNSPPSTPVTPPASSPPPKPPGAPPPPSVEPPANSPPPPASRQTSPPPPAADSPKSSPSPPGASPPQITPSPPGYLNPSPPPAALFTPPPPISKAPPSHSSSNATNNNSTASAPGNAPSGNSGDNTAVNVGIGVGVAVLLLGLIGIGIWFLYRKKKRPSRNDGYIVPSSYSSSAPGTGSNLIKTDPGYPPIKHIYAGYQPAGSSSGSGTPTTSDNSGFGHSRSFFSYEELYDVTNGFSDENLLGEGGFGSVYKGILPDGRLIAVKQLKIGGGQGEREFKAEVDIISRVHHRHLVSLVGYCIFESRRLLVYDFVPNNTLHYHLHEDGVPTLVWPNRLKIAAGAARGLAYLHEDCHPRIIHRDIKSSNILLDNKFEAQVSDFGLARLAVEAATHISTRVMGTFGYLAPEYATTGKLTEKSDVFSYGVVLLELITGRKPVDTSQPVGDESLVEWARPLLNRALESGELEELVDPRLEKNFPVEEMIIMIEAAAACVRHLAVKRPKMGQVARTFDSMASSSDLTNGMKIGASEIYDPAQQSAEFRWFRRMAFDGPDSTDLYSESSQTDGKKSSLPPQSREAFGKRMDSASTLASDIMNINVVGQNNQNMNFSGQSSQSTYSSGETGPFWRGQSGPPNMNFADQSSESTYSSGEAGVFGRGGKSGPANVY